MPAGSRAAGGRTGCCAARLHLGATHSSGRLVLHRLTSPVQQPGHHAGRTSTRHPAHAQPALQRAPAAPGARNLEPRHARRVSRASTRPGSSSSSGGMQQQQQQQQQDAAHGALEQLRQLVQGAEASEERLDAALAQQLCDQLGACAAAQEVESGLLARLARQLLAQLEQLVPPAPGDAAHWDAGTPETAAAVAAALSRTARRLADVSAPPGAASGSEQVVSSGLLPVLAQTLQRVSAALVTDAGQLTEAALHARAGWLRITRGLAALTHAVLGAWPRSGSSSDSGSAGASGGSSSSSSSGGSDGGALACAAAAPLAVPYAQLLVALQLLEVQQLAPDAESAGWALQAAGAKDAAHALHCAARLVALVGARRAHSDLQFIRQTVLGGQPGPPPPPLRALARQPWYLRLLLSVLVSTLDASGGGSTGASSSAGASGSSGASTAALASSSAAQQPQQPVDGARYVSQLRERLGLPAKLVELWRHAAAEAGPQALDARQLHAELQAVVEGASMLDRMLASDDERRAFQLALQLLAPASMLLLTRVAGWLDAAEPACSAACMDAIKSAVVVTKCFMPWSGESQLHLVAPLQPVLQLSLHILERAVECWGAGGGSAADTDAAQRAAQRAVLPLMQLLTRLSEAAKGGSADERAAWQGVAARLVAAFEAALRRTPFPYISTFESALCCIQELAVETPKGWGDDDADSGPPPLLAWSAAAPGNGPEQAALLCLFVSSLKALACRPELGLGLESSPYGCWRHWAGAALHMAASNGGGCGDLAASSSGNVPWLALYAHVVYRTTCQFEAYLSMVTEGRPNQRQLMKACVALWEDLAAMLQLGCGQGGEDKRAGASPAAPASPAPLWVDAHAQLPQLLALLQQQPLPAVSRAGRFLVIARMLLTTHREAAAPSPLRQQGRVGGGGATPQEIQRALVLGATVAVQSFPAAEPNAAARAREMAAVAVASSSAAELLRALQRSPVATSLPQQLTAWAADVVATLPHRFACNNPGCTSLAGASEQALVRGTRCICAGCRTARYCCAECQTAHWPQHKPVCRRLKREAAAAAAAEASAIAASAPE